MKKKVEEAEDTLVDELPDKVATDIPQGENILLCLKGTNKEWLVCTNKALYIMKHGYMTGHMFGAGVYQMPYKNITNVQVNFHLTTGYFEVSAGGMQDAPKNYWSNKPGERPQDSPNCVTITGKPLRDRFQKACEKINKQIADETSTSGIPATTDTADEITKLASLHSQGILTDEEFAAKKKQLLGI